MSLPAPPPENVRFGDFRLDLTSGELSTNGHKTLLQDKPLKVLLALLERPGEIVPRDQLKKRLWDSDTFVDFDLSLNKAVNRLRDALNDSADKPLFVETLPRKGYRWIGPSAMSASTPTAISENIPELGGQDMRPKDGSRGHAGWQWKLAVGLVLMVALTFAGFSLFPRRKPLTDKDSILIADFQNSTGNPVFTETLKQALITELAQSPFLNIFPQDRVQETLQYMGRSPSDPVTPAIAREICERRRIRAVLRGSISNFGRKYVIALDARNCRTGDALGRQEEVVDSADQALHGLEKAATRLRRQLGESLSSIRNFSVPLEQATTSSLEALQAYSYANLKLAQGGDLWDAVPFLVKATELDPNFAMAHATLGEIYSAGGATSNDALAEKSFKHAFELRSRVSEREKLYIVGTYYEYATRELDKATQAYELWKWTYPEDVKPFDALAGILISTGEYEKAEENAHAALLLRPKRATSYERLSGIYIYLNRLDHATSFCQQAASQHIDGARIHLKLLMIAYLNKDAVAMQNQLEWYKSHGNPTLLAFYGALLAAAEGQLHRSEALFREVSQLRLAYHDQEGAALAAVQLALIEAHFGHRVLARRRATTSLPRLPANTDLGSVALIMAGDDTAAKKPIDRLLRSFPHDTLLRNVIAPIVAAQSEINHGHPERAIQLLRSALPFEFGADNAGRGLMAIYLRGQAHLRMRAAKDAGNEFQKIIDHPGIDPFSPLHALAYLGRARASGLEGDPARTRAAYEEFFARWKDADGDLPIMVQARAEYKAATKHAPSSSKSSQDGIERFPLDRALSANLH